MSILEEKLANIINSSRIDFYNKEVKEDLNSRNINLDIVNEINKIWNSIKHDSRVAIYGAGNHTIKLFEIINRRNKNITCVVDNLKPIGKFLEYPLINKEHMKDYDIDVVFISTLGYSKEIKEEVVKEFPNIEVIDLYEELQRRGYSVNQTFFYQIGSEMYSYIYEVRNIYENESNEKYLSNLIYTQLKNRDFLYAYKYIDEYIQKNYIQSDLFKSLRNQLDIFINDIKNKINEQEGKNGLIFLIDSLRWKDVYKSNDMKFIKTISENSINCHNAYTHVPYTSMSILSMITEKKLFESDLVNKNLPIKNQGIFHRINTLKYKFKYYGNQVQFFEESMYSKNNINNMPYLFWKYICDTYEKNQNNISIIHIMEAHAPYIAGNHSKRPKKWEIYANEYLNENEILMKNQQRKESLIYIDEQLKYYYSFFNKNTSLIITSDHGNIVEGDTNNINDNLYVDDQINIPYIISDNNILKKEENRLFTHLDTSRIICNLVQSKDPFEGIEEKKIIEINRDFTYSIFHIEKIDKMNKLYLGRAYKCFRSKKDKYIVLSDGEELFYIMPDEDKNLINEDRYKLRIEEIKSKINNDLPKFNEDRYKYARKIYDKDILENDN